MVQWMWMSATHHEFLRNMRVKRKYVCVFVRVCEQYIRAPKSEAENAFGAVLLRVNIMPRGDGERSGYYMYIYIILCI